MTITITIRTGNEAIQTSEDIADVLRELVRRMNKYGAENVTRVFDANGNTIGTVTITTNG